MLILVLYPNLLNVSYYIKKNKVIDYLVISDWNNPIKELDNWIQNVE